MYVYLLNAWRNHTIASSRDVKEMKSYSDKKIITAIQKGDDRKSLDLLYENILPTIKRFILSNSGREQDVYDVFQEAVIIFYNAVRDQDYKEISSIKNYMFGVSRNIWFNQLRRKKKEQPLDISYNNMEHKDYSIEENVINNEKSKLISDIFSAVGGKCTEILQYVIYEKLSMRMIAKKMGMASEDAAKMAHYRCKKKLIKLIKQRPHLINELKF